MKRALLFAFCIMLLSSCNKERPEPDFYKNLYTGEVLNKKDFENLSKDLGPDSTKEPISIVYRFFERIESDDSIIQPFKYDLRVGKEYIVRSRSYDKIGTKISPKKFELLDGSEIVIGGKANKPTLINLWFTSCGGCIQEMPILNDLRDQYAGKVNFIAMTFNEAEEVSEFLEERKFNFRHVTNARDYIDTIKSYPYPENIFIDKNGVIKYIEQGASAPHFESIIDELLEPTALTFAQNNLATRSD